MLSGGRVCRVPPSWLRYVSLVHSHGPACPPLQLCSCSTHLAAGRPRQLCARLLGRYGRAPGGLILVFNANLCLPRPVGCVFARGAPARTTLAPIREGAARGRVRSDPAGPFLPVAPDWSPRCPARHSYGLPQAPHGCPICVFATRGRWCASTCPWLQPRVRRVRPWVGFFCLRVSCARRLCHPPWVVLVTHPDARVVGAGPRFPTFRSPGPSDSRARSFRSVPGPSSVPVLPPPHATATSAPRPVLGDLHRCRGCRPQPALWYRSPALRWPPLRWRCPSHRLAARSRRISVLVGTPSPRGRPLGRFRFRSRC